MKECGGCYYCELVLTGNNNDFWYCELHKRKCENACGRYITKEEHWEIKKTTFEEDMRKADEKIEKVKRRMDNDFKYIDKIINRLAKEFEQDGLGNRYDYRIDLSRYFR